MKLNLGSGYSGWDALHIITGGNNAGWKCVEVCPLYKYGPEFEIYDFTEGIREADNSAELIWMGDVLEHVYKFKTRDVLVDCFRVLKPGGEIWLSVPDMDLAMSRWLAESAMDECADLIWGQQDSLTGRNSGPDSHHNGFTERTLSALLRAAGFVDVKRTAFHKTWFELGMSGRKPA